MSIGGVSLNYFDHLPDETVQNVLYFVGATPREICQLSKVCRRWRSLVQSGQIWRPMALRIISRYATPRRELSWKERVKWFIGKKQTPKAIRLLSPTRFILNAQLANSTQARVATDSIVETVDLEGAFESRRSPQGHEVLVHPLIRDQALHLDARGASILFSQDQTYALFHKGELKRYNAQEKSLDLVFKGPRFPTRQIFSQDAQRVCILTTNSRLHYFNLQTGALINQIEDLVHISNIARDVDGNYKTLAVQRATRIVYRIDLDDPQQVWRRVSVFPLIRDPWAYVTALSHDAQKAFVFHVPDQLSVIDIKRQCSTKITVSNGPYDKIVPMPDSSKLLLRKVFNEGWSFLDLNTQFLKKLEGSRDFEHAVCSPDGTALLLWRHLELLYWQF